VLLLVKVQRQPQLDKRATGDLGDHAVPEQPEPLEPVVQTRRRQKTQLQRVVQFTGQPISASTKSGFKVGFIVRAGFADSGGMVGVDTEVLGPAGVPGAWRPGSASAAAAAK
jgi:hypothetical protein